LIQDPANRQRQNVLAVALAGQAIGWLPGMMGAQRTVMSTDLDFAFGDDPLTPAADACTGALRLMADALGSLTVAIGLGIED